jgi:abortive infection bacteriophage resistance protein
MRIPYEKPYLDIRGQIDLPKSHGMIITDEPKAASYLERLGYYRLSGY